MVIAYHIIITAYGWWLPNDLRGSTSRRVCCDVLNDPGELHFGRKKIQPAGFEIREFYNRAVEVLKHDLLTFDDRCVKVVSDAFSRCIVDNQYTCYGGVIMPDHGHLCIRKHKHFAEEMIQQFQKYSAEALVDAGLRSKDHPVWSTSGWKVFLDDADDVRRTVHYIEQNPMKMNLPIQRYPWITSYDNWPFHNRLTSTSSVESRFSIL